MPPKNPGGPGAPKSPEHKKIGVPGKILATLGVKSKKQAWRADERYDQSKEHDASPDILAERLDDFYYKLNHTEFHTNEETNLAKLLYKQLKTHPEADEESRAKEARVFILTGLIPRDRKEPMNEDAVGRQLRAYLMWRWVEKEWHTLNLPETTKGELTKSLQDFRRTLLEWVEKKKQNPHMKLRPPSLPESNLAIALAKRLKEDHTKWEVTPMKPE